jgi:hypothetical protein
MSDDRGKPKPNERVGEWMLRVIPSVTIKKCPYVTFNESCPFKEQIDE